MKRVYVVVGELEDTEQIDVWYGAYTSMEEAELHCMRLEAHPDNKHIWYWREVILKED